MYNSIYINEAFKNLGEEHTIDSRTQWVKNNIENNNKLNKNYINTKLHPSRYASVKYKLKNNYL